MNITPAHAPVPREDGPRPSSPFRWFLAAAVVVGGVMVQLKLGLPAWEAALTGAVTLLLAAAMFRYVAGLLACFIAVFPLALFIAAVTAFLTR